MTQKSNPTKPTPTPELVITRVFNAPRPLVFDAWTKPEHLQQWSAPHGFTMPESSGDLRVGGQWHCCMIAPSGDKLPLGGVYREVIPNELLVFTHCWEDDNGKPEHETVVTVRFADEGSQTKVTLEQSFFKSPESRDGHKGGWSECLERLTELLAQLKNDPLTIERTFQAPVALVWKALTDQEGFKHWFFGLKEFKAEPGFEFEFTGEKCEVTYLHHCKITEVIPEKRLAYSWRYAGYEGISLVTIDLFPDDNTTRLRLTHAGLETFPQIPHFARKNFVQGWTNIIGTGLKQFVETSVK